jgi:hypothetical protein
MDTFLLHSTICGAALRFRRCLREGTHVTATLAPLVRDATVPMCVFVWNVFSCCCPAMRVVADEHVPYVVNLAGIVTKHTHQVAGVQRDLAVSAFGIRCLPYCRLLCPW